MSLTTCPYPFSSAWTLRTPNFTLALDDGLDTPGSHELHAASHSVANRAEPLLTNHPTEPPWPTSGQWVDSRLASNSPSLVAKPQGTGSTVSGSNTELPPPLSPIMPLLSQIIAPVQLISRRSSWMDWAGCIVAVMIITVMSIMPDGSAGIFFSCPKLAVRSWLFSWPPGLARHPRSVLYRPFFSLRMTRRCSRRCIRHSEETGSLAFRHTSNLSACFPFYLYGGFIAVQNSVLQCRMN